MLAMKVWAVFLCTASAAHGAVMARGRHDIYTGYSVEAAEVRREADKELLLRLEQELKLDWWSGGALLPGRQEPALLMVAPQQRQELLRQLDAHNVTHSTHLWDVARAFDEFDDSLQRYRAARPQRLPFEDYPSHQQVNDFLLQLSHQYPNLTTLVDAGTSFEGRQIQYLKISHDEFADASKPVIFVQALIHAREWLTTPVVLYAAQRLLAGDEADRALLHHADFILLPVLNADGYEYTRTNIRLWRKTRSVTADPGCFGVDGNRNYDYEFATLGTSVYHCSDTWPGEEAFSEPETAITRDIIAEHGPKGTGRMQLFVDIHSHGSWVLFGFGSGSLPANAALLHACASNMAAAMDARKLPEAAYYTAGNSAKLLYRTSGTASDYASSVGVPLSFTVELPNYGRDFRVPPEYIPHVTAETWAGLRAAVHIATKTYTSPNKQLA